MHACRDRRTTCRVGSHLRHVGPEDQTQFVRLGGKRRYPLCHLVTPPPKILFLIDRFSSTAFPICETKLCGFRHIRVRIDSHGTCPYPLFSL